MQMLFVTMSAKIFIIGDAGRSNLSSRRSFSPYSRKANVFIRNPLVKVVFS
jgi:hypothetical protein